MRNSQRITELEAKTQKSVPTQIKVYHHEDNTYSTEDGRELTDEEIEEVLSKDDNPVSKIIVTFKKSSSNEK